MAVKAQKRVVVFTSPSCTWCTTAKHFFKNNGVKFQEIDITKDEKAAKDCEDHGCRGVPVVLVGSRWICGFNQQEIKKALEI